MANALTTSLSSTPKRPVQKKQNKLGPYNLLQTLGEGEFGKVKLGIHIETGQEVAIKLIKKDGAGSDSRINKVEREISVLKTLNHPYIVKLFNVVETEKYIGIILEYASGGELFEYILAHRYLKEKDAKRFFAQLISSVQYMHKRKIVHRDLKLENLLLDKNRNIKVTDFGFANQFASAADDLMATTCGSPCYAAPELVVNAGLYGGAAVDIWSCGVILYAMLCGFLPFDDDPSNPDSDNINQLYRYILSTNLMFPSHVSVDARDLLAKMLVPDPTRRCSLEYIVRHPWLESYRSFLKKDTAQIEMEALAASRQSAMPDVKSNLVVNSSASTTLPRKVTAQGANAASTRKTHIPVVTRDRFAPVANEKYLVADQKDNKSNAGKESSNTKSSSKTNSFRHFSIGRSSATTTTVEKSIHAAPTTRTSKVPNFISRKPVKKEDHSTNNDSAITFVNDNANDANPEKSLSSPSAGMTSLGAVGSIRKGQRRGTDKFLSFFTGGRASHIPVVSNNKTEEIDRDTIEDTFNTTAQSSLLQDSAADLRDEANESDQKLVRSSSETSTIGDPNPSSCSSPVSTSDPLTPMSPNTAELNSLHNDAKNNVPESVATSTATSHSVIEALRTSTSTIEEDEEGEANATSASEIQDSESSISSHQFHDTEINIATSTTGSIISEQNESSLHSNSIVSFKDTHRRTTVLFATKNNGTSSMRLRSQQLNNSRIDTGSSIMSSSMDGHTDNASLSSMGTNGPQPEPSSSSKAIITSPKVENGRNVMAAVRRSIYRKHKSQPPAPHNEASKTTAIHGGNVNQRNSAPVPERKEPIISFARSRFEETDAHTRERGRNANPPMKVSNSEVTNNKLMPSPKRNKMMDWIKKKSHAKDSKKEAVVGSIIKATEVAKPNASTQLLTGRTRKISINKKGDHAVPAQVKTSYSSKTTGSSSSPNRSSKVPAVANSRKNAISILTPPVHLAQKVATEATITEDLVVPEKNIVPRKNRALSGSEAALAEMGKKSAFEEDHIQVHQGAIDRKALTSQSPLLVIKDVARILSILGIDTTLETPYVLKCCRRKGRAFMAAEMLKRQESSTAIDNESVTSSGISTEQEAPVAEPTSDMSREHEPIYGDASIDNGDEVRFAVEMCRFKNLPGLYIVDIRRLKGNVWAYKFLYHKLIDFLDLSKNNYMHSNKI